MYFGALYEDHRGVHASPSVSVISICPCGFEKSQNIAPQITGLYRVQEDPEWPRFFGGSVFGTEAPSENGDQNRLVIANFMISSKAQ